jgi:molybdopterin-binding protein
MSAASVVMKGGLSGNPAVERLFGAAVGERIWLMARRSRGAAGDVLTAKEAAKYVRLTLPTFYRYIWEGKLQAPKIGGRYRFSKSLLDRSLGKKKAGSEDVSGRNKLVGKVTAIKRDAIMAQVDINVGSLKITAVITRDALDELGLRVGDTAIALVKATEVMVVKD